MKNIIYFCLLIITACQVGAQVKALSPNDFEKGIQTKDAQLLDVRTLEEYNGSHIANSLQADWNNRVEFDERIKHLDSGRPVYVYCLAGVRSSNAANYLKERGFTVYHLEGGISRWISENKAVVHVIDVAQISQDSVKRMIGDSGLVLLDFGAKWCPPCVRMQPSLDSFKLNYAQKVNLIAIDGGSQTTLVKAMKISGFPTLILYKDGAEVWRYQGYLYQAALVKKVGIKE